MTPIFGSSNSSDIIHDHFEKFYGFFFDYLIENGIHECISLGDLFDRRKEVHFNTLFRSNKYFFDKLGKIKLIVIAGNHDILYNNTSKINSVKLLLDNNENVTVIDQVPQTLQFGNTCIDFFPWINSGNITESLEFAKNTTSKYAVGHFEFAGFPLYPGTIAETGMDHTLFKKYDKVFSGHYHTVSSAGNIQYTGTPCELTWGDCGDPKGFWVLDTETDDLEYVRNPYTLFEKIMYTDDLEYDFSQATEKYIKIIVVSKTDQSRFDKFVTKINASKPHDVKIIETSVTESIADAVSVTDLASTHTMIADVVDNMELELDRGILKKSILELYSEAMLINNSL